MTWFNGCLSRTRGDSIEIAKVHSWLIQRLKTEGSISSDSLRSLEDEDQGRALLFLDYLVSLGIVSSKSTKDQNLYKLEDRNKLLDLEKPKPSTTPRLANSPLRLVYSVPASLIPEVQRLLDLYPDLQIVPLEEALREVLDSANRTLTIAAPFLEWDGLGYLMPEFRAAAERNVGIRLLTRGVFLPERGADYPYLDKIKTLLKMHALYEAGVTAPDAKFEVRDFTTRIATSITTSLHYEGIHQKMAIADRKVAYIGSGEIRAASFIVNGECGVLLGGTAAGFWSDFFEVFWKAATPVPRNYLRDTLTISKEAHR